MDEFIWNRRAEADRTRPIRAITCMAVSTAMWGVRYHITDGS
jgi:hypothetical protein